jgi:polyisoprenoid-binding protein YceI
MRTLELRVLVMAAVIAPVTWAQVPVFEINRAESSIQFSVKASIEIAGTFENWSASVKFSSPELTSAILDIRIQAASVHTGSDVKDGAERERFLRCGAESVDEVTIDLKGKRVSGPGVVYKQ